MATIAFVPARSGSVGIPGKHVRSFCGQPLIRWVVGALEGARDVDRVVVATDCEDVAHVVSESDHDKAEVFWRSPASACDTASPEAVILEFLWRDAVEDNDVFVLAHATSPFTSSSDFNAALTRFTEGSMDSLVSVVEHRRYLWSEGGTPVNFELANRPRRQDHRGGLMENGAFYISRAGAIRESQSRVSGVIEPYVMPAYTGIEIGEEADWITAEALMEWLGSGQSEYPDPALSQLALTSR